jgi:hypothetical protein
LYSLGSGEHDHVLSYRCGSLLYLDPSLCHELSMLLQPYDADVRAAELEFGTCRLEELAAVSLERYMYWWSLARLVSYDEPSKVMRYPSISLGVLGVLSTLRRAEEGGGKASVLLEIPRLEDEVASMLAGLDVDVLVSGAGTVYADEAVPARRAGFVRLLMSLGLGGSYVGKSSMPEIGDTLRFEEYASPCNEAEGGAQEPRRLPSPLAVLFRSEEELDDARGILEDVFRSGAVPFRSLASGEVQAVRVFRKLLLYGFLEGRETVSLTRKGVWALMHER